MSLRILFTSDTHKMHPDLSKFKDLADVLVHSGDLTGRGGRHETEDELFWLGEQLNFFDEVIFVPGNHDFFFERFKTEGRLLAEAEGIIFLNDSGIEIDGVKFWGSAITPEFCSWAFNRKRGEQIDKHWKIIPKDTDVLITHGPPYGVLDKVNNDMSADRHQGCNELLFHVTKRVKPEVHAFGHIHEGYGQERIRGTHFVNSSFVNEYYIPGNQPIIVEVKLK